MCSSVKITAHFCGERCMQTMESESDVCVDILQPGSSRRQQSLGFRISSAAEAMTSEHLPSRDASEEEDDSGFMDEDALDGPHSADESGTDSCSDDNAVEGASLSNTPFTR